MTDHRGLETRTFSSQEIDAMLEAARRLREADAKTPLRGTEQARQQAEQRGQAVLDALESRQMARDHPMVWAVGQMAARPPRPSSAPAHHPPVWVDTQSNAHHDRRNCQLAQAAGTRVDPALLQDCFDHRHDRNRWYPSDEHVHATVLHALLLALGPHGQPMPNLGPRAVACAQVLLRETAQQQPDPDLADELFAVMLSAGNTPLAETEGVDILLAHFAAQLPDPLGLHRTPQGASIPRLQAALASGARTLTHAILLHAHTRGRDMDPEITRAEQALLGQPSRFDADSPQHPVRMVAAARRMLGALNRQPAPENKG